MPMHQVEHAVANREFYSGIINHIKDMMKEDPARKKSDYWDAKGLPACKELARRFFGNGRAMPWAYRDCAITVMMEDGSWV